MNKHVVDYFPLNFLRGSLGHPPQKMASHANHTTQPMSNSILTLVKFLKIFDKTVPCQCRGIFNLHAPVALETLAFLTRLKDSLQILSSPP